MERFLEWEVNFLYWLSQQRNEVWNQFVHAFNFIGGTLFISVMLPFIYWTCSKRLGFRLSLIMFSSLYTNMLLKDFFQFQRPFQEHTDKILPLIEPGGHSFPSGHAQQSMTFWGYIAYYLNRKTMWVLAAICMICIGLSRMYSGVHFPKDILAGWLMGAFFIIISLYITKWLHRNRLSTSWLIGIAIGLPIILLALYKIVAGEVVLDRSGVYQSCGLLAFSIVAHAWEREKIRFIIPSLWRYRILAFVIGLVGILIIEEGFKYLLPIHPISDFFRFGLMGFWTIALAPFMFVKGRLYEQDNRK